MSIIGGAQVRKWRKVNSDLAGLLDEWATSLFRELDYKREARNGKRFKELFGTMQVSGRAWQPHGSCHVNVMQMLARIQA